MESPLNHIKIFPLGPLGLCRSLLALGGYLSALAGSPSCNFAGGGFRVQGFGPYQKVLADLTYNSNGLGLLPHPAVGDWIKNQASILETLLLGAAI